MWSQVRLESSVQLLLKGPLLVFTRLHLPAMELLQSTLQDIVCALDQGCITSQLLVQQYLGEYGLVPNSR